MEQKRKEEEAGRVIQAEEGRGTFVQRGGRLDRQEAGHSALYGESTRALRGQGDRWRERLREGYDGLEEKEATLVVFFMACGQSAGLDPFLTRQVVLGRNARLTRFACFEYLKWLARDLRRELLLRRTTNSWRH